MDSNNGWIAGDEGMVSKTTDGGATWQDISAPTDKNFEDVCFPTTNLGFAISDGLLAPTMNLQSCIL